MSRVQVYISNSLVRRWMQDGAFETDLRSCRSATRHMSLHTHKRTHSGECRNVKGKSSAKGGALHAHSLCTGIRSANQPTIRTDNGSQRSDTSSLGREQVTQSDLKLDIFLIAIGGKRGGRREERLGAVHEVKHKRKPTVRTEQYPKRMQADGRRRAMHLTDDGRPWQECVATTRPETDFVVEPSRTV